VSQDMFVNIGGKETWGVGGEEAIKKKRIGRSRRRCRTPERGGRELKGQGGKNHTHAFYGKAAYLRHVMSWEREVSYRRTESPASTDREVEKPRASLRRKRTKRIMWSLKHCGSSSRAEAFRPTVKTKRKENETISQKKGKRDGLTFSYRGGARTGEEDGRPNTANNAPRKQKNRATGEVSITSVRERKERSDKSRKGVLPPR